MNKSFNHNNNHSQSDEHPSFQEMMVAWEPGTDRSEANGMEALIDKHSLYFRMLMFAAMVLADLVCVGLMIIFHLNLASGLPPSLAPTPFLLYYLLGANQLLFKNRTFPQLARRGLRWRTVLIFLAWPTHQIMFLLREKMDDGLTHPASQGYSVSMLLQDLFFTTGHVSSRWLFFVVMPTMMLFSLTPVS